MHRKRLGDEDAGAILGRHLSQLVSRALKLAREADNGRDPVAAQVAMANRIAEAIASVMADAVTSDDFVADGHEVLLAVAASRRPDGTVAFPDRPDIPLSTSALLVNGHEQPQVGRQVVKELDSADQVDLLCAFIKWHGLRLIDDSLQRFIERGGRMRVITTTYIGATERRALDRLVGMGAEVKINYETRTTRLHAKAWLFRRASQLDTAYVGSSNLSKTALTDGKEWNVRLARAEQPHLLDTFQATFDEYWADPSFETYVPSRDTQRLDEALKKEAGGPTDLPLQITNIAVTPYPYQREILDEVQAARKLHGHWRNLAVMATGTGKTVVAALDYKRLRAQGAAESLLFVAHRKEILQQSLLTFRQTLQDGSFGELLVDGQRPQEWRHVFASIQSLSRLDIEPDHFDMVIVDEFHHAEAATYTRLLDHLKPKVLLGLTATPERTDGADILHWFDGGKPTVELRLWEALERDLLVPFHYFGIHDATDLSQITWRRGTGYDIAELTNLYTGHDARVSMVIKALADKLANVRDMRAVGFCVSIAHAEFMATRFNQAGIPSVAVTSATDRSAREQTLIDLRNREINVVFTVDLFNEGVDVPQIDTVLFLRPTESATVFLQQLGRGLRFADDKPCLTVLDFVGRQNVNFRFDLRYRALTGDSPRQLERDIHDGFPTLPAGCHIDLDREVSKLVLENLKQALNANKKAILAELRSSAERSLAGFLDESGLELEDLYSGSRGGWVGLRREAGLEQRIPTDPKDDRSLASAIGRMLHIDDPERIGFVRDVFSQNEPPRPATFDHRRRRLLAMLHASVDSSLPLSALARNLARFWRNPARRDEVLEITEVLRARLHRITPPLAEASHIPLRLHATYTKDEILAAFGMEKPRSWVAGVRWMPEEQADIFFVTINKTEDHFSPQTMYSDRAISPTEFQWESQHLTRESSETGQRYIHHADRGSSVHLFIREYKGDPFTYAGPMTYESHEGERPMRVRWQLAYELPADVFHYAKVTAG
ncbi:DEAD/DEAH box helicase [Actinoallomurus spadix]|uniref:DEAD/DEAH box helicase n=1 Tax=Actinoallomurus spadix TaxID=79912 RepID=A0ABN0WSF1_9ACTN